jgi:hypothetical protein
MAVDWMKQGEESAVIAQQEASAQAARKETQGKAFKFYLGAIKQSNPPKWEEASVWFVDGEWSPKYNAMIPPRWYEHNVLVSGNYTQFICPEKTLPAMAAKDPAYKCPFCATKDYCYLASAFTVIDLRPYTTKDGSIIPATRKLFIAKPGSMDTLNKLAAKRGGLVGCRFDISRTGEKKPGVGDVFDFQERVDTKDPAVLASMRSKFTRSFESKGKDGKKEQKTVCLWEPLKYSEEVIFRTGDELRKMGFGSPAGTGPVNVPADGHSGETPAGEGTAADYEGHL